MNAEQTITLTLTVNEVNLVLAGLIKLPFEAVNDLVAKVRDQGNAQIPAPTEQ